MPLSSTTAFVCVFGVIVLMALSGDATRGALFRGGRATTPLDDDGRNPFDLFAFPKSAFLWGNLNPPRRLASRSRRSFGGFYATYVPTEQQKDMDISADDGQTLRFG